MLNIEVNRSAEGVERYFDRELAVSDYLMKEPGTWAGRGAERLGLRGPIQRSQFVALLRNENPTTGKRLTARMNTSGRERRGGQQPAGWLRARVRSAEVAQHLSGDHGRSGG
jgi:hypothetical protein